MLRTGIVVDARYQDHYTGRNHPERPARIGALLSLVEGYQRPGMKRFEPRPATPEEIALVHDPPTSAGSPRLPSRTTLPSMPTRQSLPNPIPRPARHRRVTDVIEATMTREVDNGFALVRPPGHHAERNRAMGFCLFNSAAIGAQYLREKFGLKRILLMDWDLHHGNGTQQSFYDDPGILYVSTHQYPYYPGTGAPKRLAKGRAKAIR